MFWLSFQRKIMSHELDSRSRVSPQSEMSSYGGIPHPHSLPCPRGVFLVKSDSSSEDSRDLLGVSNGLKLLFDMFN